MKIEEDIIVIAGPTASGKTGLAINLAKQNNAVIFNADSMQVYRDLQVLTARPSLEEEAQAPHFLFGHRDGAQSYSVAAWLDEVKPLLADFHRNKRKVIFVGGTGLYFNALLQGISPIPEIPSAIREKWRAKETVAAGELHSLLAEMDPTAAKQVRNNDRQRILRALEVFESTGKSIIEWQQYTGTPPIDEAWTVRKLLMMPERSVLHSRINSRFDIMIDRGAQTEVRELLSRSIAPSRPVMKAIGVPQLASYLAGDLRMDIAIEQAKAATRQYAKRQSTWFRNSFDDDWERV